MYMFNKDSIFQTPHFSLYFLRKEIDMEILQLL